MNYLEAAYNELFTYRTPKKIIEFVKAQNLQIIIGNPEWHNKQRTLTKDTKK